MEVFSCYIVLLVCSFAFYGRLADGLSQGQSNWGLAIRSEKKVKSLLERPPSYGHLYILKHAVGLFIAGTKYFEKLCLKSGKGIVAVTLGIQKLYIVTDASLVSEIYQRHKDFPHRPLISNIVCHLITPSGPTVEKWVGNIKNRHSLYNETAAVVSHDLRPGISLREMIAFRTKMRDKEIRMHLNGQNQTPVNLLTWVRYLIMTGTGEWTYGPMNPFKARDNFEAYWNFSDDLGKVALGAFPNLTARACIQGREHMVQVLEKYFDAGLYRHGSMNLQEKVAMWQRHGLNNNDIARMEVMQCFAATANTASVAFWVVYNVFSEPEILMKVRAEAKGLLRDSGDDPYECKGPKLDIEGIRKSQTLRSIVCESIRCSNRSVGFRVVEKDTIIGDRWLLERGRPIIIANHAINNDQCRWSGDPNTVRLNRFEDLTQQDIDAVLAAFGGGTSTCPGRYLALAEISALLCLLTIHCEIEPTGGRWIIPSLEDDKWPSAVASTPRKPLLVNVRQVACRA